jgi:hypothetical protein
MSCPICYSNDADTIVCWNEHSICKECYDTCMNGRRSSNKKCASCRQPMFDWREPRVDDPDLNAAFDRIARIPGWEERLTEYDRLAKKLRRRARLGESVESLVPQLDEVLFQRDLTIVAEHPREPISGARGFRTRALPTCSACGVRGHTRAQRWCRQHPRHQEYLAEQLRLSR